MRAIKNIQNLSVAELFSVFLNNSDERYVINDIDFRFHIRNNTNDFDSKSLKILYAEIRKFIEYQILLEYNDQIYTLRDLLNFFDDANYSYTPSQLLYRLSKIVFDNLMEIEYINHDAVIYIRRYNIVFKEILEELEFDINENQKNILTLTQNNITNRVKKKDLHFIDLFKDEYYSENKIKKFKDWLKRSRFINDKYEVTGNYSNFAKIYYLLRYNGITLPNIALIKGITAFFDEFNVDVVTTKNKDAIRPQITRVAVTNDIAKEFKQLVSNDGTGLIFRDASKIINDIFEND